MDLRVEFLGVELGNPTVLASGVLGVTRSSLENVAGHGAGAVTIKSISREPRVGHKNPIIITYEAGMMNAVGYSNPGFVEAKKEFTGLENVGVPVFASIVGGGADDFAYMAENFLSGEFAAVEIPLSCPHTPGFGTLAGQGTPEATEAITQAVKEKTDLPVIVKLSPSIQNLTEVALAAEAAGADAINMGNTHGPGMVIDIKSKKPVLDFKVGGLSGPGIRPITVRCVYDIYENVKIPIIGCGGITTPRDAVEMILAGATLLGIGTAAYYEGVDVFEKICSGLREYMEDEGVDEVRDLVGGAH